MCALALQLLLCPAVHILGLVRAWLDHSWHGSAHAMGTLDAEVVGAAACRAGVRLGPHGHA